MKSMSNRFLVACVALFLAGAAPGVAQGQSLKPPVDLEKHQMLGKSKKAIESLIGKPDQVREEKEGPTTFEAWIYAGEGRFVFGKMPVKRYNLRFKGDIAQNAGIDH
jgi:hypothetical protein